MSRTRKDSIRSCIDVLCHVVIFFMGSMSSDSPIFNLHIAVSFFFFTGSKFSVFWLNLHLRQIKAISKIWSKSKIDHKVKTCYNFLLSNVIDNHISAADSKHKSTQKRGDSKNGSLQFTPRVSQKKKEQITK